METKPLLKLTLLMPSQCAGEWQEPLQRAIQVGFSPDNNPKGVETVMAQLKRGRYRAYVLGASLPEQPEQAAVAIAICYRVIDEALGQYVFFIWALLGTEHLAGEDWQQGFRMLRDEARKLQCNRIQAISNNPRVIELVEQLGGKADKRLINLEV